MFKNATFLSFYFADNQLFSNSETLVNILLNPLENINVLFKRVNKWLVKVKIIGIEGGTFLRYFLF
jgi:hypothetical protein